MPHHDTTENDEPTAVALHAVTHGLTATTIPLPTEDAGEWHDFRAGVIENLAPDGDLERELAATVAELLWRRRRVARAEQQAVEVRIRKDRIIDGHRAMRFGETSSPDELPTREQWQQLETDVQDWVRQANNFYMKENYFYNSVLKDSLDAVKPRRHLPEPDALDRILRYEAHINRQLYHAMHALEALQARRRGESTPLARVSVHGLPGT